MILVFLASLAWLVVVLGVLSLAAAAAGAVYAWQNVASEAGKQAARAAMADTREFFRCLGFFVRGGDYTASQHFGDRKAVRARVFSMCLAFRLWAEPHYRNGSFQDDMKKNLRNVAIPGTGVPLSVFAAAKPLAYLFVFAIYPLASLVAAVNVGRRDLAKVSEAYRQQLLEPTDWFGFWRLNCALASYHAWVTHEAAYKLEDKLTFLQVAKEKGVAVSPFLEIPALICKHRNEEGGLGYQHFSNAVAGGDWIIQEVLANDKAVAHLLPENAPLSTFRVITMSTCKDNVIVPLSCVWRAGRSGAITDHSAVLFDVDSASGAFKKGVTNTHWYRLGLDKVFTTQWTVTHDISHHPDNGAKIEGEAVDSKSIMDFAKRAHETMMPGVPIIGWDVALTDKGMLMLECNLSCNFFLGSFDHAKYFEFVDEYFRHLEFLQVEKARTAKQAGAPVSETPAAHF